MARYDILVRQPDGAMRPIVLHCSWPRLLAEVRKLRVWWGIPDGNMQVRPAVSYVIEDFDAVPQ